MEDLEVEEEFERLFGLEECEDGYEIEECAFFHEFEEDPPATLDVAAVDEGHGVELDEDVEDEEVSLELAEVAAGFCEVVLEEGVLVGDDDEELEDIEEDDSLPEEEEKTEGVEAGDETSDAFEKEAEPVEAGLE